MSPLESILVLVAGFAAGTINAVIGSGTLITFPVLLAVGYPPIVANVSNNIGLVPGAASAALGYREQLRGSGQRLLRFAPATIAGSVIGSALLLSLPENSFKKIVPVLIVISLILIVFQPRISRWATARRETVKPHGGPLLRVGIFGTGIYGGYFGAAQGILLFGMLAISLPDDLRELNAVRAVLAGIANAVAAIIFIFVADVAYLPVALIAVGSTAGGLFGAGIGKRLPDPVLRGVIVVVGIAAILKLVL